MAYLEAMKCLTIDTTKNRNTQKEEKIHGGLLLLNELLRVSDVKFEVGCFLVNRLFLFADFFIEYLSRFNSSSQCTKTKTNFI
jgi:hypothetical protein